MPGSETSIATEYDGNGNATRIVETFRGATGARETRFSYDAFDRPLERVDRWGERIGYGYDAVGNRTRLTDPDGKSTQYAYDALNRNVSVLAEGGATSYGYLRNGLLQSGLPPVLWTLR